MENMKNRYFKLVDEKRYLEDLAYKMFEVENELVWHNEELEQQIFAQRQKINATIEEIKSEMAEMREKHFTREQLREMKKQYNPNWDGVNVPRFTK